METPTHAMIGKIAFVDRPRFSGFSHASLPCRDLTESKRFYTEVLGGELIHDAEGFAEVRLGGVIIGFSEQAGGWTARGAEYPHYAFFSEAGDFFPMKQRLESYGVPTHDPWTRDDVRALMYFRDPSGNLFEMYCPEGYKGKLRRGARAGGDYGIDFEALNYDWKGGPARPPSPNRPFFTALSHITIPCRDVEQEKRFFTEVLGGEIALAGPKIEIRVAGALFTFSPASSGWTGRDAEFPHYAFFSEAVDFLPMKEWLDRSGVKTHQPWTRDGKRALMYFRDPSGNLFEMYCPSGLAATASFPRGPKQGGDYVIDFGALNYDWKG